MVTAGGWRDRIGRALAGKAVPLRKLVAGVGWYPLVVLTALNLVDELDRAAVSVFAPNIRRYFDIPNSALGGIVGAQATLLILLGIPLGYLGTRIDRPRILRLAAIFWGFFSAATAVAVRLPLFVIARLGTSIGKATVEPLGRSLLADYYPPTAWTRVLSIHNAASPLGGVVGPLMAGAISLAVTGVDSWRWAFPIVTIPTFIAIVAAIRLREPQRQMVKTSDAVLDIATERSRLPMGQAVTRLMRIPTFYRQLVGIGVLGFALIGALTFSSILYDEVFGVGEGGRGLIIAILATAQLGGTLIGGVVGERVFQAGPPNAVRLVAASIFGYSVLYASAVYLPRIELVVAVQWLAMGVVAAGTAPLYPILSSISPPRLRPLAFGLLGLFVALFGGVLGGVLVGAIADAGGIRLGLLSLAPFGVLGALLLVRGASTIEADIATIEQELMDEEALSKSKTESDLALRVRNLNFSYGNLRVLFDVNVDVRAGEIVALLGTNGAGKSTLLRAVSGLDMPDRGTVRFFGEDITWLDAETRVQKGIVQVPGGRGTFPSLSVLENLRMGGYLYRRDRSRVESAIKEVFGYFPVLEKRKHLPAGTLSGGEQQMLALGRAFIARPKLLMVDELSLGLAPVILEQLLGIVRAFSAQGTTVILVEQSVNLALSIATTAYFMERGQIRFGGPAADLLERHDLLRSVFLEGAEQALTPAR
jgi:ABC-type branched-subunit amino acid transport system ATPase component/predicted MFS family arabinose efflux permease